MGTIDNMGAEVGATCTIFPYTDAMGHFLHQTCRSATVNALQQFKHNLKADEGAEYNRVIKIVSLIDEPFLQVVPEADLGFLLKGSLLP